MPNYWIFAVTAENWQVIKENKIYGSPKDLSRLVQKGDYLIFYVKLKGADPSIAGKFVGVYKVVSDWIKEDKPLWPDEEKAGKVLYPFRVKLELVKLGVADFKALVPKLNFIRNKLAPYAYMVGTPANLKRPIPVEDFNVMMSELKEC